MLFKIFNIFGFLKLINSFIYSISGIRKDINPVYETTYKKVVAGIIVMAKLFEPKNQSPVATENEPSHINSLPVLFIKSTKQEINKRVIPRVICISANKNEIPYLEYRSRIISLEVPISGGSTDKKSIDSGEVKSILSSTGVPSP